jgi:hypothetical protein
MAESFLNKIRNNEFLSSGKVITNIHKFFSTDSEETFNKNLKIQPIDWYYRSAGVTYTFNNHGYRTDEFNTIDWKNSIVIFGCSHVFGVGIDDQYTLDKQLSYLISKPVINMGIPGSSISYALHNALSLRSGYDKPFAVINIWPEYSRTLYYQDNEIEFCGSWNVMKSNYMRAWFAAESHVKSQAILASKNSKILWENTKYLELSYYEATAELLNCEFLNNKQYDSRDCMHFGIKTQQNTARIIADNLKL